MASATNFDKHMKKALDESVPKLTWIAGWHPEGQRWKVDLAGVEREKDIRPRVLIEAELKKDDPAANVIKIWRWARAQKNTRRILLVQGFSKLYWQKKVRFRERAEFVGERMAEARLHIDYRPRKIRYRNKSGRLIHFKPKTGRGFHAREGAGRLARAAEGLAKEVARLIRST
jgi:hypothetical protein